MPWRLPRRWRRPSARLPGATRRKKKKKEEKELARTRVGTRQVQGPKWARARSLGRLAGMLQAQAKRMPKDKILKKNRVGSLVAAHQAADRFAQRQRLRRQLRQELPRGSVGAKLADLLDSDCESCSGRRRTSHATAAERAADYVKRVRERVVARGLREQAAAEEDDDEEEETEVEVEDDRSHWASVGLISRTLRMERAAWRAAWELRFPWKGERPVRQLPAASRPWRSSWTAARHTM